MLTNNNEMMEFSGFCYVIGKEHTYVSLLKDDEGQCVEIKGARSRIVPNLFVMDADGNSIVWTLVKEVEKQLSAFSPAPSGGTTAPEASSERGALQGMLQRDK